MRTTWKPHEKHGRLTRQSDLPDSVYAFPKQRKEPLTDARHVRNAVARFDQVIGVSEADRALAFANLKKAARHYGVDLSETSSRQLGVHPQRHRKESARKAAATRKKRAKKSTGKKSTRKKSTRKKSTRKYGPRAQRKVERAMHEMKQGKLRSGRSRKKVTSRKQAIAIGLSEARKAGAKVPSAKKKSSRSRKR
jgi:Family of unknown function (DUF6496)